MIGQLLSKRYEITNIFLDGPIFVGYVVKDRQSNHDLSARVLKEPFSQETAFLKELQSVIVRSQSIKGRQIEQLLRLDNDPVPYILSEYTRGPTLSDRIRSMAPFSVSVSIGMALSVCTALEVVHSQRQVHGDLTGSNIIMRPNSSAILQLTGIYRAYAVSGTAGHAILPGLAPYLAPELSRGEEPSAQSDVYSVGILLFELLTGRKPFLAEGPAELAVQHRELPLPALREINPSVPVVLEEIVKKALAKNPGGRYRSAGELAADLRLQQEAVQFGKTLSWPLRGAPGIDAGPVPKSEPKREEPRPSDGRGAGWPIGAGGVVSESRKNGSGSKVLVSPGSVPGQVAPNMGAIREPEPETERERRRRERDVPVWMLVSIAFMVAVALSLCGVWLLYNFSKPTTVRVPNIKSLSVTEARVMLDKLKLDLRVRSREPSDRVEQDRILDVSPEPGKEVREGGRVEVVVSAGSRSVELPDVRNQTADKARSLLEGLGLTVESSTKEEPNSEIEIGSVIRTEPSAKSKVDRLSRVQLVLSAGRIERPEFAGRAYLYSIKIGLVDLTSRKRIRLDVVDSKGTKTAFEDTRGPGDTVDVNVTAYGESATFRLYYDDELRKEFEKTASEGTPDSSGGTGNF